MTWNHAFTLAFSVPKSQYHTLTVERERDLVIAALLHRVAQLVNPKYPDELAEALGAPFDSYDDSDEEVAA